MNISLNWLKKYIDLEGVSVDTIEEKLTTSGLEVEEIIDQNKNFENFVVGYVKEKKQHSNADKLSVCIVTDGTVDYNVVCGAPNVDAGQKIAFAKVGAVVPNGGFEIKKAKIRGEVSLGMICAEDELGLGDDHSGIIVLDDTLEVGTPLADALGMNDVIIEISITPNRADALSHIGVARDLAALLKQPLRLPEIEIEEVGTESAELASIEIENTDSCKRYVGKVVTDVEIKDSPDWMKKCLTAIGLRPINNVVDVTNFVLHEIGQPLHGFDLDQLAGKKIIVKNAKAGEKFVTLDSKERELKDTDLMICDAEKNVAIAGVMGGENSEVTETTKNILIESAYFDPSSIRKTSKLLGLSTDASYRFERGCDPNISLWAAKRAAQLLAEVSGGKVCKGEIDVYPYVVEPKICEVRYARITKILGFEIPVEEVKDCFGKLGFEILEETEEKLKVSVPTFRHDIEREIDLIEEVARIHGYDDIPAVEKIFVTLDAKVDEAMFVNKARETVIGLGFNEIVTNSLLNEDIASVFGNPISVLNPQNQGMTHLRPSLIPGSLQTISKNLKVKENSLKFFEVGHTFNQLEKKEIKDFEDFTEIENIQIAICGKAANTEWFASERNFDFFDLKGFVNEFEAKLGLAVSLKDNYITESDEIFEYSFTKSFKKNIVGKGGKVNSKLLSRFDIEQDVFIFSFNITALKELTVGKKKFQELLKYPKVIKDFAFILDKSVSNEKVISVISNETSNLLKNIKLFDIFESKNLGEGKRSLAYQLEFYDSKRTLTEEEVDKEFRKAIEVVKSKLNGELRGE
ncbi:MAG: phenylalanine--tRNA ligase subunit beta [Melioribacteraceae bacterium]|nr:phenylalanine--tRNA ligase subunit beta [Melioribacteraceae bacterium]